MLQKQPHRRYLQVADLLADLRNAMVALESSSAPEVSPQNFLLNISQIKNFAENGFLSVLRPQGVVVDVRAGRRVVEFIDAARHAGAQAIVDPVSHYVRSPLSVRPARFRELSYENGPVMTGFSDDDARARFCGRGLDNTASANPDVVISPYFYAGEGEQSWLTESIACAITTEHLLAHRGSHQGVWAGFAVHSAWLSNEPARDALLTALTARQWTAVHLLVATTQPTFGPLGDVDVLRGLRDLIAVLRDAGTPLIVGRRASSGLLLLALGAEGWSTGVSGNLMNMTPHPEDEQTGGPSLDRVYVPSLLNLVSTEAYVLMRSQRPELVELETAQARELLNKNPGLEDLRSPGPVAARWWLPVLIPRQWGGNQKWLRIGWCRCRCRQWNHCWHGTSVRAAK